MRLITILIALALSAPAQGEGLPPRPEAPDPVPGECTKTFGLQKGVKPPADILPTQTGTPTCSAIAVPLSDYADLLQTERWAKALKSQYFLDMKQLQLERDHYAKLYEEAATPEPWHQRPAAQRAVGGITVLLVVLSTGAIYASAYNMHSTEP